MGSREREAVQSIWGGEDEERSGGGWRTKRRILEGGKAGEELRKGRREEERKSEKKEGREGHEWAAWEPEGGGPEKGLAPSGLSGFFGASVGVEEFPGQSSGNDEDAAEDGMSILTPDASLCISLYYHHYHVFCTRSRP